MKLYNQPRGTRKTTRLIYISEFNDIPIVCMNEVHKKNILEKAEKLNVKIPTPIIVSELNNDEFKNKMNILRKVRKESYTPILVDEFDMVALQLFADNGLYVVGATMTKEMK